MASANVLLGLGANLGDPVAQLSHAVDLLGGVVEVLGVSRVYRSEPVGHRGQPDFFNLVVHGRTSLPPVALLRTVLELERAMGRVRDFPNSPRIIDIDLLAYGERVVDTPELVLPHPRMAERAFVLLPLAEVAPGWRHPLRGRTARELLQEASRLERICLWGALPPPGLRPAAG